MAVEARMRVTGVTRRAYPASRSQNVEEVTLEAVVDGDTSDDHPNEDWSKYTPYAEFELHISNPAAFGYFEPGAEYRVIIRKSKTPTGFTAGPPPVNDREAVDAGWRDVKAGRVESVQPMSVEHVGDPDDTEAD